MPGHIISARQNLGEMLLDANDPAQALQAFEAALQAEPFRFWSLYGAGRAAELSGEQAKAEAYYAMLVGQTASADVQQYPHLNVARAFLEKECPLDELCAACARLRPSSTRAAIMALMALASVLAAATCRRRCGGCPL